MMQKENGETFRTQLPLSRAPKEREWLAGARDRKEQENKRRPAREAGRVSRINVHKLKRQTFERKLHEIIIVFYGFMELLFMWK